MAAPLQLTRMHRVLIGVVVAGAVIIAGIGFAGSYAAVRELALKKGFGNFSYVFPIGIDAGICVLLALDLLLTWIRIPFPLLRQTAWLLTAATIAFNGAAAWPDPLGVGMHAVIPILFVVSVEAARHAIGRIADITADKHMEGVRLTRWLLSPVPTFLLWRRMKLWELRSYEQVIKLEQERLVYQARLRSRFGRSWRRKAPVESLMPLRLARYGVPLAETAPAGLAAAGIEPALIPPAPQQALDAAAPPARSGGGAAASSQPAPRRATTPPGEQRLELDGAPSPAPEFLEAEPEPDQSPWFNTPREVAYQGGYDPAYDPEQYAQWFAEQQQAEQYLEDQPFEAPSPEDTGSFPIPVGPGRTRELGEGGGTPPPGSVPVPEPDEESFYQVFKQSINGSYPTPRELIDNVEAEFGIGLPPEDAKRMVNRFTNRHNAELEEDHIA
ncbi:membrane protein [Streptomyces massasporeus]|nr:membrane protein [Streptomyces massasporeus]